MLLEQLNCTYYPSFNPLLYPFGNALNKERLLSRVLIIDDDREMNELLKSKLKDDRRLKLYFAEDPFEAMELLNRYVVDTIILDWNLPEMSGPETLSKAEQIFKSDPNLPYEWETKKAKVVIMTGKDRSECRTSNTKHFKYSGFINKKGARLQDIVESILKQISRSD